MTTDTFIVARLLSKDDAISMLIPTGLLCRSQEHLMFQFERVGSLLDLSTAEIERMDQTGLLVQRGKFLQLAIPQVFFPHL